MKEQTDWEAYYRKPSALAGATRAITRRLVTRTVRPYLPARPVSICELGGANSCIAPHLSAHAEVARYHIVDTNAFGLALLDSSMVRGSLTRELHDACQPMQDEEDRFDLVLSIGLIEHFDAHTTGRLVERHFQACRPGGLVLLTFPTPTPLYRSIRTGAERLGIWNFPDERPLAFSEVEAAARPFGQRLEGFTNWWIGLTQGVLLYRKHEEDEQG